MANKVLEERAKKTYDVSATFTSPLKSKSLTPGARNKAHKLTLGQNIISPVSRFGAASKSREIESFSTARSSQRPTVPLKSIHDAAIDPEDNESARSIALENENTKSQDYFKFTEIENSPVSRLSSGSNVQTSFSQLTELNKPKIFVNTGSRIIIGKIEQIKSNDSTTGLKPHSSSIVDIDLPQELGIKLEKGNVNRILEESEELIKRISLAKEDLENLERNYDFITQN